MPGTRRKATGWEPRPPDLDPTAPPRSGTADIADLDGEAALDGVRLDRVRAVGGALAGWRLRDTVLTDCDLAGVVVERGEITRVAIGGGKLSGCAWLSGSIRDLLARDVRADDLTLRFCRLQAVSFVNCRLTGLDLSGARLDHVEFRNCRLEGVRFHEAETVAARFAGCDLSGATGVAALRNATVDAEGLATLAPALAAEAGITVGG